MMLVTQQLLLTEPAARRATQHLQLETPLVRLPHSTCSSTN